MNEEWRVIPGYPNYEVSDLGRIRNIKTGKISIGGNSNGYRIKSFSVNGKIKSYGVHCLVALAFLGERPTEPSGRKYQVNHKDCNRENNRLDNLEYVTSDANVRHSYEMHPYWTRNLSSETRPEVKARRYEWSMKYKESLKNGK